ncbi:NAD-dependent succinate-semialdehyde dehydrogenase [Umezawaea sp. NPDC059074]|uniref:NAD-dependent succinate-semialdehyde dehydrogenase n=1 Tax=Umezawaea sp. NPDC059074 TaxID=3346716 RepID=UPI0036960F2B
MTRYATTDPTTGTVVATVPTATDEEVRDAVDRSAAAYADWARTPVGERSRLLRRVAELFLEQVDPLAEAAALEMGKPLREGWEEAELCAEIFAYYADNAEALLADRPVDSTRHRAVVQKRPLGPLLGIMPWNFPYYQVARFAAPNLLVGNTILLKHAPGCPRSAAALEDLLHAAGVPRDVYLTLYATDAQVGDVIADPRVRGVSLTGGERAGAAVAEQAGRHLTKVVLELGGSDPAIVLDSDDPVALADTLVLSRVYNAGQACNAPKRLIVVGDLHDVLVDHVVERVSALTVGDPRDPATDVGPLSSRPAAEALVARIDRAVADGAVLHVGGTLVDGTSAYVRPAVLTGIAPGTVSHHEEFFGPVVVLYRAADVEEAVALANDTPYGLGASVFSADADRARAVAERIDAGMVFLNEAGGSWAEIPFGGVKRSGFGRELGTAGITEFVNDRVVKL